MAHLSFSEYYLRPSDTGGFLSLTYWELPRSSLAIFVFIFMSRMTFVYVFVSEVACLPFNLWNSSSIKTSLLPSRGSSSPCQDLYFWHWDVRFSEEESQSKSMMARTAGEGQSWKANPSLTNFPDSVPSSIIALCLTTVHLAQGACKRWIQGSG